MTYKLGCFLIIYDPNHKLENFKWSGGGWTDVWSTGGEEPIGRVLFLTFILFFSIKHFFTYYLYLQCYQCLPMKLEYFPRQLEIFSTSNIFL